LDCKDIKLYAIDDQVQEMIKASEVNQGLCVIFVEAPTCAIVLSAKAEESVCCDILEDLERVIPARADYVSGADLFETAAYTKSALTGPSLDLIINNGKPLLGNHQGIYLANYVKQSECKVTVSCVGINHY
jgi:secondary thiamine-phosphate synthase enzyme